MINFLQVAEVAPEAPLTQQYSSFIFIGLMLLAMWLLIWRPESKKRKDMAKFRDGLKKGDKIVTAGGIYGVIKEVKDASVLIEVDSNVTLRVDKTMITADPATQAVAQKK
ncbi:MAG: preprotein translocase subunit YajC [Rikenellaceae bacterium]